MTAPSDDMRSPQATRSVGWAIFRMLLGQLQIAGAVFTGVLLLSTGINRITLEAAVATTALTLISVLLFSRHPMVEE